MHRYFKGLRTLVLTVISLGFTLPVLAAEETLFDPANGNDRFESSFQFQPADQMSDRYMRWNDEGQDRHFSGRQMNFNLRQWGNEKSQGNVYLISGLGSDGITYQDKNGRTTTLHGMQVDFETAHLYTSAKFENFYNQDAYNYRQQEVRVGFSPSPRNDKSSARVWLMLVAQHLTGIDEKMDFMPSLRLLDRNFMTEANIDLKGNFMINAVYRW